MQLVFCASRFGKEKAVPEEKTIPFYCPVCKSGWEAKAIHAGKQTVCPKCHAEIIVPLLPEAGKTSPQGTSPAVAPHSQGSLPQPLAIGADPSSLPASNETAAPAGKKNRTLPLLLGVGIPAVLIAGTIIGILIVDANRGTVQPKAEAAQADTKSNPVSVQPKNYEPKEEDRKWMEIVENYLKQNVHKYVIVKTYPTEPVIGAYFRLGGKDDANWLPLDRPLSEDLLSMQLPAAQAKELERLRGKPLEKMSLDDLLKIESEALKKFEPEEFNKRAEKPKKPTPEELKKIEADAQKKKEEMERQAACIRAGRALRLEYDTDEGFGRLKHYDIVFVIDADGKIVHLLPTQDFRIGKPPEK
jgi:hypothetical protein